MQTGTIGQWLDGLREAVMGVGWAGFLGWLGLVLLVVVAARLARGWVEREVEDVNRRHVLRKATTYVGAGVALLAALALIVGRIGQFATIIGLLGAGLAIALKDVGTSMAGWIYVTTRPGFGPGSRAEVGGVEGEVIDVGMLNTTLLEVGNLVHGRQSSGRLATIPNSKFLTERCYFSPSFSPYNWQEIQFLVTYESDWRRGVELLEGISREVDAELDLDFGPSFRELERRYAFKVGPTTPIVYVTAADSGVQLTLRHLSHIRQRRIARDRITRAMLDAVDREPSLEFAYPTTRFFRRGEEEAMVRGVTGPDPAPEPRSGPEGEG